jgi:hypothetical protein
MVGKITEKWIKASYPKANGDDVHNIKHRSNTFFEFISMTEAEFIDGFKKAKDRLEWAKQTG